MNGFKVLPTPESSPADPLLYRALELQNSLRVLLISDPTATMDDGEDGSSTGASGSEAGSGSEPVNEQDDASGEEDDESDDENGPVGLNSSDVGLRNAAAALSVGSGSFHEPMDAPGLAHFLEHMVFMGSKKYPDENKFDSFVSARNGWDNAYTDAEQTVYYFEVKPSSFDEALDIWSRFYIDPIMSKDSVNREIQAVDSEFSIAQTKDDNRICGILTHLAAANNADQDHAHPAGKFGWGNILSLKGTKDTEAEAPELYNNLLKLHKKFYSAKIMNLAVQSPHSLDELQDIVISKFSEIPNNSDFVSPFSVISKFENSIDTWSMLYGEKLLEVLPVGDKCNLYINFQLPSMIDDYQSGPADYISWLLGHEGKGSVHNFLEEKGFGLSLSAGIGSYGDTYNKLFSIFEVEIVLTEKGAEKENLNTVISAVFNYLDMLRKDGVKKDIWDMITKIDNINWKTKELSEPSDNVEGIAGSMSKYPSEHWLIAGEICQEYSPEKTQNLLDLMTFERSIKMFINPDFRTKEEAEDFPNTEKWFGVRWRTGADSFKPVDLPENTFYYPGQNPYLTDDLEMKTVESEKSEFPILLKEDKKGCVYFKPDFTFKLPKGDFRLLLRAEKFNKNKTAKQHALYYILPTFLVHMATAELYDANTAGFSYSFNSKIEGFSITGKGISAPLNKLVNTLIRYLTDFKSYDENLFKISIEKSIKSLKTSLLDSRSLANDARLAYLIPGSVLSLEGLRVLENETLTVKDMENFVKEFLKNARAECVIHGNFTKKEALNIYNKNVLGNNNFKTLLKGTQEHHEILVRKLTRKRQTIKLKSFNTRSADNHYVLKMYQFRPGDLIDDTILEVVTNIISEPTFNILRTKHQLGYVCFSSYKNTYGVLGMTVEVKSAADSHSLSHIKTKIEEFTNGHLIDLFKSLPDETFENYKKSLIVEKSSKDNALKEEAGRNFGELEEGDRFFDRELKKIEILEKMTKKEVTQFALELLRKSHILDVHVEGNVNQGVEASATVGDASVDPAESVNGDLTPSTSTSQQINVQGCQGNDPDRLLELKKSLDNFEKLIFLEDSDVKDLKKKGKTFDKLPNLKSNYEMLMQLEG